MSKIESREKSKIEVEEEGNSDITAVWLHLSPAEQDAGPDSTRSSTQPLIELYSVAPCSDDKRQLRNYSTTLSSWDKYERTGVRSSTYDSVCSMLNHVCGEHSSSCQKCEVIFLSLGLPKEGRGWGAEQIHKKYKHTSLCQPHAFPIPESVKSWEFPFLEVNRHWVCLSHSLPLLSQTTRLPGGRAAGARLTMSTNLEVSHTQLSNYSLESDRSALPFTDGGCMVKCSTTNEKAVPARGGDEHYENHQDICYKHENETSTRESACPSTMVMGLVCWIRKYK